MREVEKYDGFVPQSSDSRANVNTQINDDTGENTSAQNIRSLEYYSKEIVENLLLLIEKWIIYRVRYICSNH